MSICLISMLGLASSCGNDDRMEPLPDWWFLPDTSSVIEDNNPKPAECGNNVVAHRGGSAEVGSASNPDNSLASLRYAISLGIYASECDIYWTKDDNVVVAHADENCQINGLYPWEHTLKEIQDVAKLSNGETIPSLRDMLDVLMKESHCTRLWLDIKNITYPSTLSQYPINAVRSACEIIKEKKAVNFVEFICTSNPTVMSSANLYAQMAGISIGWMANKPASTYTGNGYSWANLNYSYMAHDGGARTIEEFEKAGIPVSVFVIDDDILMDYYAGLAGRMKAIVTNYPKKLLEKIEVLK